jgi:hypothetical protein
MLQKYYGGKRLRTAMVMPFSPAMRRESNEREEAHGVGASPAAVAAVAD